jgi:hypothetical protein
VIQIIYSIVIGYCFCKDNPTKEVEAMPQVIKMIQDVCPKGEINRCLCEDNSKADYPFDLFTWLLQL